METEQSWGNERSSPYDLAGRWRRGEAKRAALRQTHLRQPHGRTHRHKGEGANTAATSTEGIDSWRFNSPNSPRRLSAYFQLFSVVSERRCCAFSSSSRVFLCRLFFLSRAAILELVFFLLPAYTYFCWFRRLFTVSDDSSQPLPPSCQFSEV